MVAKVRFPVARARKQAPKTKRAGRYLPDSPLLVSAKRHGGKGFAGLPGRKSALGKEELPPFWVPRNAGLFCPGRGSICLTSCLYSQNPMNIKSFQK